MNKVLLTATPPTSNGDLHVGHLSGPYIAADVYRRFCRLTGKRAFYNFGGDDNQSYVATKAHESDAKPAEVTSRFNDMITTTLERASMAPDCYVRPLTSTHHRRFVELFFRKLFDEGQLVAKEAEALWCVETDRFLYEAHVTGRCSHCGEIANGNVCEACARPNLVVDLIEPVSRYSQQPPVKRRTRQLFFPLSRWRKELETFFENVTMSSHLASLCESMLRDGLPDIPVSNPTDWGIPTGVPGFDDQTIYAWFEMAPGYLSSTQEMLEVLGLDETWQDYWKAEDADVVQFFGFDNGYFHAILFPAAWLAFDRDIKLPSSFVVNEFFRLDGEKFSTSRGHAVWGQEALEFLQVDVLRYYLSAERPETEQTNFQLPKLRDIVRRQLVDSWQEWLLDLGGRVQQETGGRAPEVSELTINQSRFAGELLAFRQGVTSAFDAATFSPQRAVVYLNELVRTARAFSHAERHWNCERKRHTALSMELSAVRLLAVLSTPIMPGFGTRLWAELGFSSALEDTGWPQGNERVPAGQNVTGLDTEFFVDPGKGVEGISDCRREREASK